MTFCVVIKHIFGIAAVSLIYEAEGLVHWLQKKLMVAEQCTTTCKSELSEKLKYKPVRMIFHIAKYPLSVIFASLRLFSFWLQKCFPTGWSSEVRFTGERAKVGHWATSMTSRNQIPQHESEVQSAVFPWLTSYKGFLWRAFSLDQNVGPFLVLTYPLFVISWSTENRNVKSRGSCKIECFLIKNNTYV